MRRLALLLPLFLLTGCFSTKFYSTMNPLYEGTGLHYQRLLVQFVDSQPAYAQTGERMLRDKIAQIFGKDIDCYLFSEIFYEGSTDPAELKQQVQAFKVAKNIDAVLVCLTSRNLKTQQVLATDPNTHITTNNYLDQKIAGYRMELIDTRAGKSIWMSTAQIDSQYSLVSFDDMMKGFIEKSALQLKKDDLLGVDNRLPIKPNDVDKSKTEI